MNMGDTSTKGGRIRFARQQMKLSQSELALRLSEVTGKNVQKGNVSAWETNRIIDFSHETLIALEQVTGFSLYWIVTGAGAIQRGEQGVTVAGAQPPITPVDIDALAKCIAISRTASKHSQSAVTTARVAAKIYSLYREAPGLTESNLRSAALLFRDA